MKLGSLFDGSGGFPLGGIIAGMIPVWSSEIEPFPIAEYEYGKNGRINLHMMIHF